MEVEVTALCLALVGSSSKVDTIAVKLLYMPIYACIHLYRLMSRQGTPMETYIYTLLKHISTLEYEWGTVWQCPGRHTLNSHRDLKMQTR